MLTPSSKSPYHPSPTANSSTARAAFAGGRYLRSGLTLAAGLIATIAQAQSNYATPYFFTTLAGGTTSGTSDGTLTAARFNIPQGVAVDAAGNVYVADTASHTIRKITSFGVTTTLAGQAGTPGTANGTGGAARFNLPRGIAVDTAGNVYVADTSNHLIRVITPAGAVTTLAGSAGTAGSLDGTGAAARFFSPNGVAVDASGSVYVGDTATHIVRKITPAGVVTTLAGVAGNFGSIDGVGAVARFSSPRGVAVDGSGNVYVADRDNNAIRKVTSAGVVTTLAGNLSVNTGSTDGTGNAARFNQPYGVAADSSGNVYVADASNKLIRKITPAGVVTTLAGFAGTNGSADGTGNAVRFMDPQGIAVDGRGNLYVADTNNHSIRMSVFPPDFTTHPTSQAVSPGANVTLTASATSNVPITYQWQKDGFVLIGATTTALNVSGVQAFNLGAYTLVATNMAGSNTSNPGLLSFVVSNAGRLANLSIRSNAGTGAQTLIVGFVIGGSNTIGLKPLLIRGIGPSLNAFNVTGFLADPNLSVFSGTTVVASNDNWGGDAQISLIGGQVGAFALAAPTSRDAALYSQNLDPVGYTAQITGVGGTTGIALAEIYDTTPASVFLTSTPRLINVSARTQVGTGSDILIAGFSISGTTPKTLLIRAVGPTLGVFGVGGVLLDPRLDLYSGSTLLQSNDNWGGGAAVASASAGVGAFTLDGASRDAVLLVSLLPGSYTAQVSGVGNTTGVALVEIYDVP